MVYQLLDGEYQFMPFRGTEPARSQVFPNLKLSVDNIFAALQLRQK
ncbi:hypothetical protein H6F76_04395 [Leptolyngbya sp. FACHB-321]|nr:hypothetical protein [Leptolyngbya sp. FACHB-321]MBD2034281.1 hypothetical protein [Leptolyngbya sp. FACHB-321]